MKRLLTILIVLTLAVTACGNDDGTDNGNDTPYNTPTPPIADEYTIAVAYTAYSDLLSRLASQSFEIETVTGMIMRSDGEVTFETTGYGNIRVIVDGDTIHNWMLTEMEGNSIELSMTTVDGMVVDTKMLLNGETPPEELFPPATIPDWVISAFDNELGLPVAVIDLITAASTSEIGGYTVIAMVLDPRAFLRGDGHAEVPDGSHSDIDITLRLDSDDVPVSLLMKFYDISADGSMRDREMEFTFVAWGDEVEIN